jgi:hypothetical protein
VQKLLHYRNLAIEAEYVSTIDLGSMNKGLLMENKDTKTPNHKLRLLWPVIVSCA